MAGNSSVSNNDYAGRMNQLLRETMTKWWKEMTKEELLSYIAEQPDITADHLRQILSNEDFVMNFGVSFSASSFNAEADFHNA